MSPTTAVYVVVGAFLGTILYHVAVWANETWTIRRTQAFWPYTNVPPKWRRRK